VENLVREDILDVKEKLKEFKKRRGHPSTRS